MPSDIFLFVQNILLRVPLLPYSLQLMHLQTPLRTQCRNSLLLLRALSSASLLSFRPPSLTGAPSLCSRYLFDMHDTCLSRSTLISLFNSLHNYKSALCLSLALMLTSGLGFFFFFFLWGAGRVWGGCDFVFVFCEFCPV